MSDDAHKDDGPRVLLGYHGTSTSASSRILSEGFTPSANEYDWLGDGVYFFQDAPHRAMEWAEQRFDEPSVIRAHISLDGCMDLLDIEWFSFLNDAFDEYLARAKRLGLSLPIQTPGAHRLDRVVINYAIDLLERAGSPVRSVRAAFSEGRALFPGSAIYDRAHVQIAVRDLTVVLDAEDVAMSPSSAERERSEDDKSRGR